MAMRCFPVSFLAENFFAGLDPKTLPASFQGKHKRKPCAASGMVTRASPWFSRVLSDELFLLENIMKKICCIGIFAFLFLAACTNPASQTADTIPPENTVMQAPETAMEPESPSLPVPPAAETARATATARPSHDASRGTRLEIENKIIARDDWYTYQQPPSQERYGELQDNPVKLVAEAPVSTFSIDVDTGSYSNIRRMLNHGQFPPADAVRVEEMINYFPYDEALPKRGAPFAVHTALAPSPWNADNILLRIVLKGEDVAKEQMPPVNLVFLVDVSGSMNSPDKLPLLCASLKLLVQQLRPEDRISLVTYAGSTKVVLSAASGSDRNKILAAIDQLSAGGSTAGASGIQLAYQEARTHFIAGGINRILLATDGDFNVGITDFAQLKKMVEEKRKSGVSLSTLGFGTGNYNEHLMEQLADVGNGAYSYIDTLMEGHKVLVNEATSTLATIAKDVKIQIEFNPAAVREYRLIGYENRLLAREDFNNDKVDAGDIGAGHTVTALYELTPADKKGTIDALRYAAQDAVKSGGKLPENELAYVKLRYKKPNAEKSELIERVVSRQTLQALNQASGEFRFAVAVAGFGQILRDNTHTGAWQYEDARKLAASAIGEDPYGYRAEFVKLVALAQTLAQGR
jgi:Ca-activated chloride channel family protein